MNRFLFVQMYHFNFIHVQQEVIKQNQYFHTLNTYQLKMTHCKLINFITNNESITYVYHFFLLKTRVQQGIKSLTICYNKPHYVTKY